MEVRVLAPTGVIGAGFKTSSLDRGISLKPHVIACDAGSTDSGPYALGTGIPKLSREATKRDLKLLMLGREKLGVPLIIGSCGTSGRNDAVDWMADIAREIAREENLSGKLALIYSDQEPSFIQKCLVDGKIKPLNPAPEVNEQIISESHIVGMMGSETIGQALDLGADIILAGRASDSALYAVVPERMGAPKGLAWHAAKTIECGAACCVSPAADGLIAYIREDSFEIEPLDLNAKVTPLSVAAHTLYENENPFLLKEPAGTVDTENSIYEATSDRTVKVSGSTFVEAELYSIKLEGSRYRGYQTAIIGGIRDPKIFNTLQKLLPLAQNYFKGRINEIFNGDLKEDQYSINFKFYGLGAVMLSTDKDVSSPSEVGVLITITAPDKSSSQKIASMVAHVSAHLPIPGYDGLISTIAYPFSPPELDRGECFEFTLNHVLLPDDLSEVFKINMEDF